MFPTHSDDAVDNTREGLPETEGENVDSKEIVGKLIVGSPAIDRMEREIESVVRTVLGLIKPELERWKDDTIINMMIGQNCSWQVMKGCYGRVNVNFSPCGHISLFCGETVDINSYYAQLAHEELSVFIDGMVETFPFLTNRWQRFLNAADYAKKMGWQF